MEAGDLTLLQERQVGFPSKAGTVEPGPAIVRTARQVLNRAEAGEAVKLRRAEQAVMVE